MSRENEKRVLKEKIIKGLEIVYERLIEYKKAKNTELVIMSGDEIIKVKPK